jgi:hypothetical protein
MPLVDPEITAVFLFSSRFIKSLHSKIATEIGYRSRPFLFVSSSAVAAPARIDVENIRLVIMVIYLFFS